MSSRRAQVTVEIAGAARYQRPMRYERPSGHHRVSAALQLHTDDTEPDSVTADHPAPQTAALMTTDEHPAGRVLEPQAGFAREHLQIDPYALWRRADAHRRITSAVQDIRRGTLPLSIEHVFEYREIS